jgi:hypothetical protein
MDNSKKLIQDKSDAREIFNRIVGSVEAPVSREILCAHLAHARGVQLDHAAAAVSEAHDDGHLMEVAVEKFPDVYRRFYFIPPARLGNPGTVFVPFWSYVCTEVIPDGGGFSTTELCDQIAERATSDIPEWVFNTVDEYLVEIAPVTTGFQSMSGRTLRPDTAEIYEIVAESKGPSEGVPDKI